MRIKAKKNIIEKNRMRKSTKIIVTLISFALLIYSLVALMGNLLISSDVNNKKEIYSYTNKFKYDYKVNLIPNEYTDTTILGMNENAYVTDLIDFIDLNINYSYVPDKTSNIDYTYSITSKLVGVYTSNGEEQNIWNKEYTLVEEKSFNKASQNKIDIKENIKLDLKEQNKLVKDFEQKMSMKLNAKYLVTLTVTTGTNIESEKISNKYTSTISIDLGSKTTCIKGDNNKEEKQFATKDITTKKEANKLQIFTGIITLIISILLFRKLSKTETAKLIRNEYRLELNKILRICQDKIVQVSKKMEISEANLIEVKDFGEIIKLSEELYKPILYWSSKEEEESWFCVVTNSVSYRYILKK